MYDANVDRVLLRHMRTLDRVNMVMERLHFISACATVPGFVIPGAHAYHSYCGAGTHNWSWSG